MTFSSLRLICAISSGNIGSSDVIVYHEPIYNTRCTNIFLLIVGLKLSTFPSITTADNMFL